LGGRRDVTLCKTRSEVRTVTWARDTGGSVFSFIYGDQPYPLLC
jgi:hypothetical protein